MSVSSRILIKITVFRNPDSFAKEWLNKDTGMFEATVNPLKVVIAEVAYIIVIPFILIEASLSLVAKIFSAALPMGQKNHDKMTLWLKGSVFSLGWVIFNVFANILKTRLEHSERRAIYFLSTVKDSPCSLLQRLPYYL